VTPKAKEKLNPVLSNLKDRITKLKKIYNELKVSRNKLDKTEKSVKVRINLN